MTLDQLRYFREAARYEHVGGAARALRISPSAVSAAIAALEGELGAPLFERQGRRVRLTGHGRKLAREADALLAQADSLKARLLDARGPLAGHFRLGGSHFLAREVLEPAFTRLRASHPEVTGEICSLRTGQAILEVLSGALDLAVCFSPLAHPDLELRELERGRLGVAVRRNHPLLRSKGLEALSRYPAVVHKSSPGVDYCEAHPVFAAHGVEPRTALLFDDDALAVSHLRASDAWALLPGHVITASPGLRALELPRSWEAGYSIQAVTRRGRSPSEALERLRDALREALSPRRRSTRAKSTG